MIDYQNFRCSVKKALLLLLLSGTLYIAFSKCKMFWFYLFILTFYFQSKGHMYKSINLEILGAPRKKQRYCFVRGTPSMWLLQNVKCTDSISLILICNFWLKVHMWKWIFVLKILCSTKEAVLLLLSRNTFYVAH